MPEYIVPVSDDDINRLRNSHLDKLCLKSTISPNVLAFSQSYFYRCFALWNNICFSIRSLEDSEEFCSALIDYLWNSLLDDPEQENELLGRDIWSEDEIDEIGVT